ncbi:MAG: TIGR03621 family F420-dependent LLM class oxidoreductase [Chloroflexi bacterium]|nr:MAG: TIGR03621 family F420-dependent LLM class oxidoreductase [Chloroflexota bacterium]
MPFRFSVNSWAASSQHEWSERARRIEGSGYTTLFMPDHLADTLSPFAALATAAQAATRLRVGPYVLNNDLRHPVVVAHEIATLDLLTDGRVDLGLGAGYADSEYRSAGLRFDRGATRVARLAETVDILKGLLSGEAVTFHGAHYHVAGHQLHPRPVQSPRPPILIGGNGHELLALAAREADIVSLTGATFRSRGRAPVLSGFGSLGLSERIGWIRAAAKGRSVPPALNILVQHVVIADTPRKAAEQVVTRFASVTADAALESPFLLLGPIDQIVETLRERRERWGLANVTIFDRSIDEFAPVVARLAGT